mgnify:FL=1|tara:strand:+ start:1361 stop:1636 length:276 start_codon:yes stop_codon:yes gene_type:complete
MKNKLYLVRGHEIDGENQDVFVVADTPKEAVEQWNLWCLDNGLPRDGDDDEDATKRYDPENVREILDDVTGTKYAAGGVRFIDWDELLVVS